MAKEVLEKMYLSPIRDRMMRVRQLMAEGKNVISFAAGDSDFNTPLPIKEAAISSINQNQSHYESIRGNDILLKEIVSDYQSRFQIRYKQEEILITAAGTEAIFDTMMALISEGDEVIVLSPAFINYENCILLSGGKVIWTPVYEKNEFQPRMEDIEKKITEKTKMIVINNPCNPTGIVYTKETLEGIARLAVKYNLTVFSDEVYDRILFEKNCFYSMAQFPGMKERTVIANSFSKSLAMTGWRVGYIMAEGERMEAIYKVHHYATACQPTFIQSALAEAMNLSEVKEIQCDMVKKLQDGRNKISEWLSKNKKLSAVEPKGAFYYFINVSGYGLSGVEFADLLLDREYVAVVPGEGFGREYTDYIRLSYAVEDSVLEDGLQRMSRFLIMLERLK